jgi:hypothetical protein
VNRRESSFDAYVRAFSDGVVLGRSSRYPPSRQCIPYLYLHNTSVDKTLSRE